MSIKVKDIVHESGDVYWVYKSDKEQCYYVMKNGVTHSTSVCAFALDEDGLSNAKAYSNYKQKRYDEEKSDGL